MPKNLYSEQDDEFLRANYLEMSNAVLAEHLGRTVRSVEKRLLSVLGLKRTQQDMGRIRRKEEDTRNKAEREKHRGQVLHALLRSHTEFTIRGHPCPNAVIY